jgi:hypothetical protein
MSQFGEREVSRQATGPFADRAAVAIVGANRPDVAREALKIARVESLSRPVLLVDLLGQGSALDEMFHDEDPHGVSDAARYGVSLGRVARRVPNADSLFVVPGGTETPLADDVLSDHLWGSWSEQCRRAGALLVVAAPADMPAVSRAIEQLDGMVVIGDAIAPEAKVPVLSRVPGPRPRDAMIVPESAPATPRSVGASPSVDRTVRRAMLIGGAGLVALLSGVGMWLWNGSLRTASGSTSRNSSAPIVMPGDPVVEVASAAPVSMEEPSTAWSVEVASVNSVGGAMARVRQVADSVPVPTFSRSQPAGSAVWYRLIAGAFSTKASADSMLALLRARGMLGPDAGRVVQTPYAWLLSRDVAEDQVAAQLFIWRQQGLPAYALYDATGLARIYFGAYETEADALLVSPMLDSLNLYATLTTRVGSIR